MFRVPKISPGFATYEISLVYGILKISQRRGHTRPGCLAGGNRTTYRPLLDVTKLRAIVETESMTWAERILRPEAGMVIHHTVIEREHIGWLEADSWNKPELEPRGAIIAKRVGYGTTIAYVPSPTQVPNQLPGSESSSSEAPLLVQRMDYDTIIYVHRADVWVRRTCREQQENIPDWHRLEELSNAMHPAQEGCCQLKEILSLVVCNCDRA